VTDQSIAWILTAIFFVLDLLVTTVKASFSHARLPYLLNLREGREAAVCPFHIGRFGLVFVGRLWGG